MSLIETIHSWSATALFIIFLYSCIMWFWLSDDKTKINNVSFRVFIMLEMIVSGLVLILGVSILISKPVIFNENWIYIKIFLGIVTICLVHISALKTKKFLNETMEEKERRAINVLRAITIGLLMTTYTLTEVAQDHNDPDKIEEIKTKILKT